MSPTKTTLVQLSMRAERMTELLAIGSDGNEVPPSIMDDFVVLLKKAVDQYLAERAAENN